MSETKYLFFHRMFAQQLILKINKKCLKKVEDFTKKCTASICRQESEKEEEDRDKIESSIKHFFLHDL